MLFKIAYGTYWNGYECCLRFSDTERCLVSNHSACSQLLIKVALSFVRKYAKIPQAHANFLVTRLKNFCTFPGRVANDWLCSELASNCSKRLVRRLSMNISRALFL